MPSEKGLQDDSPRRFTSESSSYPLALLEPWSVFYSARCRYTTGHNRIHLCPYNSRLRALSNAIPFRSLAHPSLKYPNPWTVIPKPDTEFEAPIIRKRDIKMAQKKTVRIISGKRKDGRTVVARANSGVFINCYFSPIQCVYV